MPLYFFRIRNGRYSGCADQASEFADRDLAWKEMTSVCADMAAGIARKLQENSEWNMGVAGRGQGARIPDPHHIRNLRIGAGPNPRWAAAAS
ncbi:hypothetical protein ACVWZ6_006779 [Bradyrhizobium sp. GM6.1]